jgi:hypothetical protein
MAIVENEYLKYDKETHQYTITEDAVIKFLPYSQDELARRVKNWGKWIPRWSSKVYDHIHATNKPNTLDKLHYKIFLNLENEVNGIMMAMIEYVFEVMENQVDLDGKMPNSVLIKLSNSNVLYQGGLNFDYDEEYGVDF